MARPLVGVSQLVNLITFSACASCQVSPDTHSIKDSPASHYLFVIFELPDYTWVAIKCCRIHQAERDWLKLRPWQVLGVDT